MAQAKLPRNLGYVQPDAPIGSREAQLFTPFRKYLTLGHTIKSKSVILYVFNNSYLDVTWSETTGGNDEGISGDVALPKLLGPLEGEKLTLNISNEGELDYLYTLIFVSDGDTSPLFIIDGTRAKVLEGDIAYMFHGHNWDDGFEDNLEWLTDIIESYNNIEQRVKLRRLPRRYWGIRYLLDENDRRRYEVRLSLRRTRYFIIPVPTDVRILQEDVESGSNVVNFKTHGFDYTEEGLVAIWNSSENYEVLYIGGVFPEYITTNGVWKNNWSKGSFIAPCKIGTVFRNRNLTRKTDNAIITSFTFRSLAESPMPITDLMDVYKSLYVFPFKINFKDIETGIENSWITLDNDVAPIFYEIKDIEPRNSTKLSIIVEGRYDIYKLYSFLYIESGRWGAFYIPQQDESLKLVNDLIGGTNYITIDNIFYTTELFGSSSYSDIEIEMNDGTFYRFGVVSSEYDEFNNERIFIDMEFSNDISKSSIRSIHWLQKSRLVSDSLTVKWETSETVGLEFSVVNIK